MPVAIDGIGFGLNSVLDPMDPYFKANKLGTVSRGDDGRMYVYAQATADIAANTAVILTEPAGTIAAGAGAWTTQAAIKNGNRAWVRSNAI